MEVMILFLDGDLIKKELNNGRLASHPQRRGECLQYHCGAFSVPEAHREARGVSDASLPSPRNWAPPCRLAMIHVH